MSEKTENASNPLDVIKWVVAIALLVGVVTANYLYGDVSVLYRALGAVAAVVVAGFIAASTSKGAQFLLFAKDSRTEVRKVVWPSRQEATQTTLVIIAATIVVGLLLWLLDLVIVWGVGLITGIGA
ncbi:preprotein translocase subunit SecE [Alteromonas sp. 5E99-2]|uniref:preprotein translocase subunit SecE n=1 Tax=Alteromonas sp. 5E99-2 TaxID=2817683 RepID=UPI001A991FAE|nr:preprotein translocase subunit SecE [Alteromonas sp. 5E99-2]MBO1255769.1 preprotein translocase subunit SecE [Alteromonas sp. 5E99-2]